MPPSTVICACCNKPCKANLIIKCSVCKKTFRHSCVNITLDELRILNDNDKGYEWSCSNCRNFGNELKDLKALILKLQNDILDLKLENSGSRSSIIDDNFEQILEEINQRNIRKSNLVIFGVVEQDQGLSASVRVENDKTEVTNILQVIDPDLNVPSMKPIRLGSYNTTKNRPIKISLNDEKDVHNVIRKVNVLKNNRSYKNISISFDRTPRQLEYYRNLRKNLKEREDGGENNLKIKYIKGIPKIISLN